MKSRQKPKPSHPGVPEAFGAESGLSLRTGAKSGMFGVMKAAYIEQTGPPENIIYGDLPKPTPGPHQVLVRVRAVSVNPIDTYVRAGMIPTPLPRPFIVGCDLAGEVEALGPEVTQFKPGDRDWGSNQGLLGRQGSFAEYAAVEECWLYPTPPDVPDEQAAAAALVGITAHLGLVRDASLKAGQTLFVNGGSGGVGTMVIQMAAVLGARVAATAGSLEKLELCRQLGAELALNYRTQNAEVLLKEWAPAGVNVWWECTREPDFDRVVAALANRGCMILMAGRAARPPFPVGPFYVKGCSLRGFAMFNATAEEQLVCARDISRWLAEKRLQPRIDRVLPLAEAAAAHRLQEENTLRQAGTLAGKIVLKPAGN
jgi:NADPH:quinone reductase